MREPSAESYALVDKAIALDIIAAEYTNEHILAQLIDAHVAERTAAVEAKWKAIEQETHNGSTLRFNMLMELGVEMSALRAAADAMIHEGGPDELTRAIEALAAYRALSPGDAK